MSTLTPKTINTIVQNHLGRAVNKPKDKNNPVQRIMDQGHELPDLAQRRMLIYGNEKHVEHVIHQPTMTHSTAWLALNMYDNLSSSTKIKSRKLHFAAQKQTLRSNFPHIDDYHAPQHIHTNVNYKPKKT